VQGLDEIVWATNPRNDNLPQFADYVGRFADECFESTGVRCWQEVPNDLPNLPLRADLRHNVFLALKEAFHNVLKHAGATEVWLRLALANSQVTVEIEDNGRGFVPEQVSPGGNGLENMRSRLAEGGGRTTFTSSPGKGTKIQFTFAVAKPG
jgi:signal transduction histidine kinase